jgi:hypothetical protein
MYGSKTCKRARLWHFGSMLCTHLLLAGVKLSPWTPSNPLRVVSQVTCSYPCIVQATNGYYNSTHHGEADIDWLWQQWRRGVHGCYAIIPAPRYMMSKL